MVRVDAESRLASGSIVFDAPLLPYFVLIDCFTLSKFEFLLAWLLAECKMASILGTYSWLVAFKAFRYLLMLSLSIAS